MMQIDLEELSSLSSRSIAWQIIVTEVKRRGHWKNKPRGRGDERKFVGTSIQSEGSHKVAWSPYKDTDFSDGL